MLSMPSNDSRVEGRPRPVAAGAVLLSMLGMAGCNQAPAKMPPPKPPVVMVAEPVVREVTDYEEGLVGQTAAVKMVEVRARVDGYLEKVNFKDGDEVEEGAVLFEIDPRPYDAEVARTEAAVGLSEAHYRRLEADLKRAKSLVARQAIGREEFDKIVGDYAEAGASVEIAKANRDLAKLNRSFARVTAPISGRLSRRMVDPGNLVRTDETILTSIVSLDPMYVYFDVDERTLLRIRRLIAEGKIKSRTQAEIPIFAALADEEGFPHKGIIDFSENRVDPNTGTLRVRAVIDNPVPRVFSPGLYMRVRLPVGNPHKSLLVAEQALGTDQGRKFLYVVKPGKDKDGKDVPNVAEYRPVSVGALHDGLRVVTEGVEPGEKIIVSGLQRLRPGIAVDPKPMTPPAPASPPARAVAKEVKPGPAKVPTSG
jgi:membrane fusion protein, multidrug efflux system